MQGNSGGSNEVLGGHWTRWIVVFLVLLVVGLLLALLVGVLDLPVRGWLARYLPDHESVATDGAQVPRLLTRVSEPLDRVEQERRRAADVVEQLRSELDVDAPTTKLIDEVFSALQELGRSLQEAQQGLEELRAEVAVDESHRGEGEEEIEDETSEPRANGNRSLIILGVGAFALAGWTLFVREKLKSRKGRSSKTGNLESLERRLQCIEQEFLILRSHQKELPSVDPDVPDQTLRKMQDQIQLLGLEVSSLERKLDEARSQIDGLRGGQRTGADKFDARPDGGPPQWPTDGPTGRGDRFSGLVRGIKSQIPVSARDMEFAATHQLLVDKRSSAGRRFKVFLDSQSQRLKVIPWVDSAHHQDELAWLQGVFDVQWNGSGEVSVVSEPSLEQTSDGYRVRSKGRLSVG